MARNRRRPQPTPDEQYQVGRRPSSVSLLTLVGLSWVVAGVVALVYLKATWKLVPGIVFIGVGLFYLRGAAATVVRRENRRR